jgi:hypothetical protein
MSAGRTRHRLRLAESPMTCSPIMGFPEATPVIVSRTSRSVARAGRYLQTMLAACPSTPPPTGVS